MDMSGAAAAGGISVVAVLVRVVVLLATALVGGLGLVRPLVPRADPRAGWIGWGAAVAGAAAELARIWVTGASVSFTIAQIALTVAVPGLARWPSASGSAGFGLAALLLAETGARGSWLGFLVTVLGVVAVLGWLGVAVLGPPRRAGQLSGLAAGGLVLAAAGQLLLSGVAFDRRLFQSGYGLSLLGGLVLALGVGAVTWWLRRDAERVFRAGAVAVALGFVASAVVVALPRPTLPTPGAPLLAAVSVAGQKVPVLVTPQRPGPNLVHFPAGAGAGFAVSAGSAAPVLAVARPGAEGTWALVDLPAGRSEITVSARGQRTELEVDTGSGTTLAGATGADGPECASAALGELVAGADQSLATCPAETLDPADASALRSTVDYLAGRHADGITLAGDGSPRSSRAADLVRQAAAADHLPVGTTPAAGNALVVVSGWAAASGQLTTAVSRQASGVTYTYGLVLAPWLLNAPIVDAVPSSLLPLHFDPRVENSLRYAVELSHAFGGENANPAGFAEYLAAKGQRFDGVLLMYSAAQVDAMPMDMPDMGAPYPGQWIPNGTIVPISGQLREG